MPTVRPIGVARTPYTSRADCPRQPDPDGPACRIEVDDDFADALLGLEDLDAVEVLLWFDDANRDTLQAHSTAPRCSTSSPGADATATGEPADRTTVECGSTLPPRWPAAVPG